MRCIANENEIAAIKAGHHVSIQRAPQVRAGKISDAEQVRDGISPVANQGSDELLAGRDFFFEHFTAADAHFFWCFRRATQFELDLSKFANCKAHFERMKTRPSVQKLLNFEKTVEVAGGYGERVEDPAELPRALERAIKIVESEKRQALLNVICRGP